MDRRDWAAVGIIATVAAAAIAALSIITGQPITVPTRQPLTSPAADVSGWVGPVPDAGGRMVLNNLITTDPGAGAVPNYPADAAAERATRGGWGERRETPLVTLRVASFLADFRNRLVWLIEYPHEPMMLGGPPGLSTEDRNAAISNGVCEFVVVMDASVDGGTYRYDGRYNVLTTLQVCWPKGANLVGGVP